MLCFYSTIIPVHTDKVGQVGGASEGLTSAVVLAVGIAVYWLWALYIGKIDPSTLAQLRMVTIIAICVIIAIFLCYCCCTCMCN